MKRTTLIIGTSALVATLAVGAYLILRGPAGDMDTAETTVSSREEVHYGKLNAARAELSVAYGTVRYLVAVQEDSGRGLIHSRHRAVLPVPAVDSERFDDVKIMRAAARRDAERFIESYTHNGGLK